VETSLDALPIRHGDVAVHVAGSRFLEVLPQIDLLVDRGLHVVSTCEELIAAPWRWPDASRALHERCRARGVRVVGTGINPGFLMDVLPVQLLSPCVAPRAIRVTRRVDTSLRRRALQLKTGAGLAPVEFRRRARSGAVGHVGLRDSLIHLVQRARLDAEVGEETLRPVLASRTLTRRGVRVERGSVAGCHQWVSAIRRGTRRKVAVLDLWMVFGNDDPGDTIQIDGDPAVHVRIEGGVQGDRGTIGMVLTHIRRIAAKPPGFLED
jgi:4-hydroxy-tetrahydrodipicolinate reductase